MRFWGVVCCGGLLIGVLVVVLVFSDFVGREKYGMCFRKVKGIVVVSRIVI